MHRDHWIPADDRTKVFRLFGCSLTPQVSHLTPARGCSLTPIFSSLLACIGEFDLDRVLDGPGGQHKQKRAGLGPNGGFTFPLVKDVGEQPIDWQNCATGALDRSH